MLDHEDRDLRITGDRGIDCVEIGYLLAVGAWV